VEKELIGELAGVPGRRGIFTKMVGPGQDALAAVVDLVVGGIPVLDDLQAGVDLAPQRQFALGRSYRSPGSPASSAGLKVGH
jgi:hypothetical protein